MVSDKKQEKDINEKEVTEETKRDLLEGKSLHDLYRHTTKLLK